MNREHFYIFQTESGEIYAHATDSHDAWSYIGQAVDSGFCYRTEKNGVATIVTIFEKTSSPA